MEALAEKGDIWHRGRGKQKEWGSGGDRVNITGNLRGVSKDQTKRIIEKGTLKLMLSATSQLQPGSKERWRGTKNS